MKGFVVCSKGDRCDFDAAYADGIDAKYVTAKFEVRERWDESLPALIALDETTGVTIDHVAGVVSVAIGADITALLPVRNAPQVVAAQLRLYADAQDRISIAIPFVLMPEAIDG